MRTTLIVLLMLAGVITTRAEELSMVEIVRGNNQFALELYTRLAHQPGNLFFSPSSISFALVMTYSGARGETAEQMARVLHLPASQEKVHEAFSTLQKSLDEAATRGSYRLAVANRLWGQQGCHFQEPFLSVTRDAFRAELARVDFATRAEDARIEINTWVEKQTDGKIKDLIGPRVLTSLTRLVLANAIYFRGAWTRPFSISATKNESFHIDKHRRTTIPLMSLQEYFPIWAGDGMKVLDLPYGDGGLSALILLTDAPEDLASLEARLTTVNLDRWVSSLRRQKVRVYLPKFRVSSSFSLNGVLEAMGMKLAFDPSLADFSGMSKEEKLSISAVIHKAFVDVDEKGTEAAAATAVVMAGRAMPRPSEPVIFRADHPFLLLLRDRASGSLMFIGRVVNPAE